MPEDTKSLVGIIAAESDKIEDVLADIKSKKYYVKANDVLECSSEKVIGYVKDGIAYTKEGVILGKVFYFGNFEEIGGKLKKFDDDLRKRIAENYPKTFKNLHRPLC